jgi:hypothetical protein
MVRFSLPLVGQLKFVDQTSFLSKYQTSGAREFLCEMTGGGPRFLTCICGTDFPISLDDLNINRCHTDASRIDRLCLWSARYVWHSFPFLFQRLLCHRYPSTEASPQGGSGPTSRFLSAAVQPLKQPEVAVHSTKLWYQMAQMSDHACSASCIHGSYPPPPAEPVTHSRAVPVQTKTLRL